MKTRNRAPARVMLALVCILALGVLYAVADWVPSDGHKMHFPQLPDEAGWDVNATAPVVLADDWMCSETGWVKDIHFWGSWKNDIEGQIQYFIVSIHQDIPKNPPTIPYSRPGPVIWERQIFNFITLPVTAQTPEGWYDPSIGEVLANDHQQYFQYNIFLDTLDWFHQDSGTIYWLNVSAVLQPGPVTVQWGWKSTRNHWNDDAVWATLSDYNWIDLYEPRDTTPPINNDYDAAFDENGNFAGGSGTDAYGLGWYQYPSGWWNIWFYDHPYDTTRFKQIHVAFDIFPFNPTFPSSVIFAINFATDIWSIDGNPPPQPRIPPLPGTDESIMIARDIRGTLGPGHYEFDLVVPNYNPEWVSIDLLQGRNVRIQGLIIHQCRPKPQSLDLSFVITGGAPTAPTGACCYPDAVGVLQCTVTDQVTCETILGGVYQGDGTVCDPPQACCLPNGQCVNVDPRCCLLQGGQPQPAGTLCTSPVACCLPTGQCVTIDPVCCMQRGGQPQPGALCSAVEACCLPSGQCAMMDPVCCLMQGGQPQGAGTTCTTPVACCLPDGRCVTLDPLCCTAQGGQPQPGATCSTPQACCLPNGQCVNMDPVCCALQGGTPHTGLCAPLQACCLPTGQCVMLDPECCRILGGKPKPQGVACTSQVCCCTGTTGNVDGDPADIVDISDLSAMVDYLFFGGAISPCFEENDVDTSGAIDISDLQMLIDFLFGGAIVLPSCP
ncbi:MAG: hypothetical protein AB1644_10900 [Candidatus Zixiibacteriota bacterium]